MRSHRKPGADAGPPVGGRRDLAPAAQLARALPHRRQPDPVSWIGGQAPAVVTYLDAQPVIQGQAHLAAMGLGVPTRIGQRLQRDPVGGHLNRGGQPVQPVRRLHLHLEALAVQPQAGGLLAQGRDQAEFVQGWWT